MTKIKICGLSRPSDVEAVNEAIPDYAGFVFNESKRKVTPAQAAAMKKRLDSRIRTVGVFVNAQADLIARLCGEGVIDLIQLHGDEDASYIASLKKNLLNPVIKTVRVRSPGMVADADGLPCDFLLLDSYRKDVRGGSGEPFDWSMIPKLRKPFFLAGGLKAENICDASTLCPYCLDVSSGAETDGVKDKDKIKKIITIVRSVK